MFIRESTQLCQVSDFKTLINGSNIFLWHDNRHPDGPLYAKYGNQIVYDAANTTTDQLIMAAC